MDLRSKFRNGSEPIIESSGWRDDMKFLFHLTRAFRYFREKGYFPRIKFQRIPNLSNARWNSRAILALLAYVLLPQERASLLRTCEFVSFIWADLWFSDQKYRDTDYTIMRDALRAYPKALATLEKFWKQEPSRLNIARSNQCAERGIKIMQELYGICRNKEKLSLRFILSNKKK